jgi:hypothetical protein
MKTAFTQEELNLIGEVIAKHLYVKEVKNPVCSDPYNDGCGYCSACRVYQAKILMAIINDLRGTNED